MSKLAEYEQLIAGRMVTAPRRGMLTVPPLNPAMFGYQSDVTRFLLEAGNGAAFLDTGLGKSLIAQDWARVVSEHTGMPVLMCAPLAVGAQHVREAAKFGIEARQVRHQGEVQPGINITNYEMLHHFDKQAFAGVVCDESSIMKSFTGQTTRQLMQFGDGMPFRLACTATPAPNDHIELGQHAQFLGVMDSGEMLTRWFITDQGEARNLRLKRYGRKDFWAWVCSWARCLSRPSDLGYSDEGFHLPELKIHHHTVNVDIADDCGDMLFRIPDTSATQIHKEKRLTCGARADCIAGLVSAEPNEPWIIWCDTDYEADALRARIPGAIEVRGSMPAEEKEARLVAFSTGNAQWLITKPRIAGFGLNWQHCARAAFVGLSFSYEQFYQALRRCWRFGQLREVHCHIAMAATEDAVWQAVRRKQLEHEYMKAEMLAAMREGQVHLPSMTLLRGTEPIQFPSWIRGEN